MLLLMTDYGWQDPYVGQVKAVLATHAPGVAVIDLLHAVPDFNPHAGAHLLAALCRDLPAGAVVLAVVDPGVGGPRAAVVVEADGRFFVGPDNGLLSVLAGRAQAARIWRIDWRPQPCSDSFHGRDLFAPIAGWIAAGDFPADKHTPVAELEVRFDTAELPRILYIDHYGNAWSGIRGGIAEPGSNVEVKGHVLPWRRVFVEAGKGEAFWHVNSSGLIEIAVNRGSAAEKLGLKVGDPVRLQGAPETQVH
ncbi:MAG: SAM-dependent chlorinase/fluorinase [Pseudomonadota bacterium]|nr:SAM-dependent chlorinase/fluorinase [Pseudomonadota bacterium]MDP1903105.1 SAM-dependent chlorinase/fluorinase [Pseudomonadota bacterium]MDP2353095.1 SAM-dependent chlorinase/fluorinase [Pseudomonadota bacterium]